MPRPDLSQHLENLNGQLASRRNDQPTQTVYATPVRAEELLDHRDEESERLSRPCLCRPEYISSS
eukprot:2996154-Rhodomonas_salina.1